MTLSRSPGLHPTPHTPRNPAACMAQATPKVSRAMRRDSAALDGFNQHAVAVAQPFLRLGLTLQSWSSRLAKSELQKQVARCPEATLKPLGACFLILTPTASGTNSNRQGQSATRNGNATSSKQISFGSSPSGPKHLASSAAMPGHRLIRPKCTTFVLNFPDTSRAARSGGSNSQAKNHTFTPSHTTSTSRWNCLTQTEYARCATSKDSSDTLGNRVPHARLKLSGARWWPEPSQASPESGCLPTRALSVSTTVRCSGCDVAFKLSCTASFDPVLTGFNFDSGMPCDTKHRQLRTPNNADPRRFL